MNKNRTFKPMRKLLVANRGEIAIRVMRAATELGIRTVGIYSQEDRFSLHRFKADESYQVGLGPNGETLGPVAAYLDIDGILNVAQANGVDAIHPGYGFLSENPDFAEKCLAAGIAFIGPDPEVMRKLSNKVDARALAVAAGTPVMPATDALPDDPATIMALAADIGYPVMVKASWGGGGRGMRVIATEAELIAKVTEARREAEAAFGNGEVYLEKLVQRARHVEVQLLGDYHGNVMHLFERDCSVQRRNQKVVERAPAPYMDDTARTALCESALKLAQQAGYQNAGTAEFLMDMDTGACYFIEVNPRIQVEHTVTEQVTGVDLVKAQILVAQGAKLGAEGVPTQDSIALKGHALQCRVTTEDPDNNFVPDYGRITAYRGATGFGIRLDGGTAYSGALITRYYDSLLEKVTAWGATADDAIKRMDRALREFRIRGVATNLVFLENLISHPKFLDNSYTTKFIDETPALFDQPRRKDRATKLLQFIGDVVVNGNAEVRDRTCPDLADIPHPAVPKTRYVADLPQGAKAILDAQGAKAVADWMLAQPQALLTDTTMRDAHQSLLATRMRSKDMVDIASTYSQHLPQLFSVECWGGATFDVAMRFLKEDPWQRLAQLRAAMPNMLLQMLLRASNGVGYTNYPDNVVRDFVHKAAAGGIDVFRVFDANNWSENMVVAMQAVQETGKICEAAMCYTGDMLNPDRPKYNLDYYLKMAAELAAAGAHIIGIKDMAGLAKPAAISQLVQAVKAETGLPIHFHTHDTSGIAASSVLAAIAAGADAVDAAFDSMSGLTSQPNLGSIAEALRFTDKNPGLDPTALRQVAEYWEHVRKLYSPFESNIRCGTSDVYRHEMPGGQYTNLRQQARSLGIEDRWDDVATAYADVNAMFGDIVKVTPTSKVVGDMALMMVTSGLCPQDVCDPATEISFPESVVQFFHGDLGQPPGGFPAALQRKVLKGEAGLTVRPGTVLPAVDLAAEKAALAATLAEDISDFDLAAYLMYPSVFKDFAAFRAQYGDVSVLPTRTFFYGMERGEEITVDIEQGKTLVIRMLAVGDPDDEGRRTVFFELNGQPRTVKVDDGHLAASAPKHPKADAQNPAHVAAPMPGLITAIQVQVGDRVVQGDALFTMEAMKMETTVTAERAGTIATCVVPVGTQVDAKDLVLIFEPHTM